MKINVSGSGFCGLWRKISLFLKASRSLKTIVDVSTSRGTAANSRIVGAVYCTGPVEWRKYWKLLFFQRSE